MLSIQQKVCSWSLIAAVVLLVSAIHLFWLPWKPTLDFFSVKQAQTICISHHSAEQPGVDLVCQFPADLHKAVVYRGAPWKAKVGRWLSGCDSVVKDVNITEKISGKVCKNDCSGQGVCNYELGQCRCFHGYSGEQCSETLYLACNYPVTPNLPYGRWVVSICPSQCDTTRAMCFCGVGTKYPYRPVAEHCGFKKNASATPPTTDWGKPDLDVFTTNSSVTGWCNVDPGEGYAGKAKFKEECHCKYDGRIGKFCEYPVISTCINQCSGHGYCRGGFCQCYEGWYGADCSIPSVFSSLREWPQWLRPAQIDMPDYAHAAESFNGLGAAVTKRRPLIYVYDLPPEFNSLLLEGRHFKFECVNRLYGERNATVWTEQLYGAQMAVYESFLASPFRTLNGEEADFFFVPILDSCIITRSDDAPHINLQKYKSNAKALLKNPLENEDEWNKILRGGYAKGDRSRTPVSLGWKQKEVLLNEDDVDGESSGDSDDIEIPKIPNNDIQPYNVSSETTKRKSLDSNSLPSMTSRKKSRDEDIDACLEQMKRSSLIQSSKFKNCYDEVLNILETMGIVAKYGEAYAVDILESFRDYRGIRSSFTLDFYKKAYDHIVAQYPYWNRSAGKDHILTFSWDEGACYAPKEIWNSMMLVHWGNTNSKHNHSTTAYWADNWDNISISRKGNHPCFDPSKDLVIPAWKRPDGNSFRAKLWARPRGKRTTLFYFNGNLGSAYENGRPEDTYSMGIRQKLAEEFGSSSDKNGKLGRQHQSDVLVTPIRSENYHEELASSVFCGVFPGDGWSGRMEDSILQGCIPVIIQDGIFLPYENFLNYESFAVRISENKIPNLIKILRGFNETEIEFKLANVQRIWQRFLYRDSILLEAKRQKSAFGHVDDWAVEMLQLTEDDVFATLIQVLHYKLHNDPWRKLIRHSRKDSGLPQECLVHS